ncbi:four helix bundle protein [Vibrio sp. PNB23_22_6]|uniref:four helix bundle protein n=1 Tax=Vibrio TaxID=662 RepID=UPI004069103C
MRFEDLEVWKRSARLSAEVYKYFMKLKDFGFKDQITRSSLSISSNIAEGYERRSDKEFINFLSYARGSSGELRSQIYIGIEIGYIERQIGKAWIKEAEEISRMISGLMKSRSKGLIKS